MLSIVRQQTSFASPAATTTASPVPDRLSAGAVAWLDDDDSLGGPCSSFLVPLSTSSPGSSLSSVATLPLHTPPPFAALHLAPHAPHHPHPHPQSQLPSQTQSVAGQAHKTGKPCKVESVGSVLSLDPQAPAYEPSPFKRHSLVLAGSPVLPVGGTAQKRRSLLSTAGAGPGRVEDSPSRRTRGESPLRSAEASSIKALWNVLDPPAAQTTDGAQGSPVPFEGEPTFRSFPRGPLDCGPQASHQASSPRFVSSLQLSLGSTATGSPITKSEALARLFEVDPTAEPAKSPVPLTTQHQVEGYFDAPPSTPPLPSHPESTRRTAGEGYFSPSSKSCASPPAAAAGIQNLVEGTDKHRALERVFGFSTPATGSTGSVELGPPPPSSFTKSAVAGMNGTAAAGGAGGEEGNGALNGKRFRNRSQSSAAVLSPPHSPPPSSLALGTTGTAAVPDPGLHSSTSGPRKPIGRSSSVFTPTAKPFEPSSLPTPYREGDEARIWAPSAGKEPSPALSSPGLPNVGESLPTGPSSYTGAGQIRGFGSAPYTWADLADREGRPIIRTAHTYNGLSGSPGASRDMSVGSIGSMASSVHSGIGISNRSPFAGTSMLPAGAGAGTAGGLAFGTGFGGTATVGGMAMRSRPRESSLGAVGTGRAGRFGSGLVGSSGMAEREGWMSGGRSLTNDLDENDEFAATRSGATSRRHSVAAFTGRSMVGFDAPGQPTERGRTMSGAGGPGSFAGMYGTGKSALTDDDLLAGDLNSLQINLEAHAAEQKKREQSHSRSPGRSYSPHSAAAAALRSAQQQQILPQTSPAQAPRQTRAPSFSAGDPYSSSAQVSKFFAQAHQAHQAPGAEPPPTSRFAFGTSPSQAGPAALPPFAGAGNGIPQQSMARPAPGQISIASVPPPAFFSTPATGLGPFANAAPAVSAFGGPTPAPFAPGASVQPTFTANLAGTSNAELNELGKGIPLHQVPSTCPLYIVEFKAGRTDLFYLPDANLASSIQRGDLVIVEADRGKDLGKVLHDQISIEEVQAFQQHQVEIALNQLAAAPQGGSQPPNPAAIARMTKEVSVVDTLT